MNESQRLARQLERALTGGAWHGPSWRELLEGVTAETALKRPIPSGHNIAEIVRHATTWQDVVRRRLEGESPEVSDDEDWPAVSGEGDEWWPALTERLFETGKSLHETVADFPAERLHESRPGTDYSWFSLIIGELQHELYHAGQVAIVRKAPTTA